MIFSVLMEVWFCTFSNLTYFAFIRAVDRYVCDATNLTNVRLLTKSVVINGETVIFVADSYCPGNNPTQVVLKNNTATVVFRRPSTFSGKGFLISFIAIVPEHPLVGKHFFFAQNTSFR